jgi:hypothetical protein
MNFGTPMRASWALANLKKQRQNKKNAPWEGREKKRKTKTLIPNGPKDIMRRF